MRRHQAWFIGCLCWALAISSPVAAKTQPDNGQLDQLLAPVALYPDALLSQILMGATYPDDVASAAQWCAAHSSLSGDAAVAAVAQQSWDPSVKALTAFPSVMDLMGRQPRWVQALGNAFLARPDAVMDSVQRLRRQAQNAGNLKSTPQQTVTSTTSNNKAVIVVQPANPQIIYVPSYDPAVVYGPWLYPAYPPYYYPPPPGSVFATALVAGFGFGIGVVAVNALWGGFDWSHNSVNINVNRYNNININQRINSNNNNPVPWRHNPVNRGNVPYTEPALRQRFDAERESGLLGRVQRGVGPAVLSPRDDARERAAQAFQGRTGHSIAGHAAPGGIAPRRGLAAGDSLTQDREAAAGRLREDRAAARERARSSNMGSVLQEGGNGERLRQQAERHGVERGSFERGGIGRSDFGHGIHFGARR